MIRSTYFSALANGDVEPASESKVIAVVRRDPPEWTEEFVDRHVPTLAPPEDLLDSYKTVEEAAERDNHDDPRRVAWESVGFEDRYHDHLDTGPVQQVLEAVEQEATQRAVWLVCWEASERWCHRRLLRQRLQDGHTETFSTDVSLPPKENEYPGHRIDEIACHPTQHEFVDGPAPHTKVCDRCGLGSTTITDFLDQDSGASGVESR
ncbi:DUF488 domain-containing protein [Halobellus limi]|uniref:DUF488 family protein n=1 Tax=Halobellus limi TaxID=699433 RepID=A0A1H5VWV5_9EURY|nr:DUF488 domain-containing protein [Halobellus limi]QCC46595.1 DUF488 family protein [Halobellus limi]SEF91690.1 Protein of unknown function, DUF488 [Halobellus limi]